MLPLSSHISPSRFALPQYYTQSRKPVVRMTRLLHLTLRRPSRSRLQAPTPRDPLDLAALFELRARINTGGINVQIAIDFRAL
jgi:hypothetical protein